MPFFQHCWQIEEFTYLLNEWNIFFPYRVTGEIRNKQMNGSHYSSCFPRTAITNYLLLPFYF